jgi:hypothetical protein
MKRDRLYKSLKEVKREVLIAMIVMLIVGGSAPWWINAIPWEHVPFHIVWKQAEVEFLPNDFEFDLNEPEPFSQYVTTVEVAVELKEGSVTLLPQGEILEQHINPDLFALFPQLSLLNVIPQNIILDQNRRYSSILLELDSSGLIPRAGIVERFEKGEKAKFGEVRIRLYYEANKRKLSEELTIPMFFVK